MTDMLGRLLPRLGGSETLDRLAALSGSDFTSVMLEVARRRAARETPPSVLRRYERDRFVRPGRPGEPGQGGQHGPGLRGGGRPDQRAGAGGRRMAGAGPGAATR